VTPAEVAAVYERAAGEIERRGGIHKRGYGDDLEHPDTCRVCLVGALNAALGHSPFRHYPLPREVLDPIRGALAMHLDDWNDAPERTTDDVTRLLRRLAQQLAEGSTT
jgi:hypothetical protein